MKFSFTIPRKGKRYNPYAKPKQEVVDTAEKNQDQDSEDASSTHQLLTHNQIQNQVCFINQDFFFSYGFVAFVYKMFVCFFIID